MVNRFCLFFIDQAALDELRRESAEKHASLQEEIQKLRLEKEQVSQATKNERDFLIFKGFLLIFDREI